MRLSEVCNERRGISNEHFFFFQVERGREGGKINKCQMKCHLLLCGEKWCVLHSRKKLIQMLKTHIEPFEGGQTWQAAYIWLLNAYIGRDYPQCSYTNSFCLR